VLLLDVDFAVSQSLAAVLQDTQQYMQLMWALQQRYVMVLPAFETRDRGEAGRLLALQAVAKGKAFAAEQFRCARAPGRGRGRWWAWIPWEGHEGCYEVGGRLRCICTAVMLQIRLEVET
jgi:hypothetical protein